MVRLIRWILFSAFFVYSRSFIIGQIRPNSIDLQTYYINSTYSLVLTYQNLSQLNTVNPFKIITRSQTANIYHPVLVVIQQQKYVKAWSVPFSVDSSTEMFFFNVSKILCTDSMDEIIHTTLAINISQAFIVSLSTSSKATVSIDVQLEEQIEFFVKMNHNYSLTVSPSEPKYVFFNFEDYIFDIILIQIDSDDETCLIVSVQYKCPVFDANSDIKYEGVFQTISLKGTITIKRSDYTDGFFLVFVTKPNCYAEIPLSKRMGRSFIQPTNLNKNIKFSIKKGIKYHQYIRAITSLFITLIVSALVLMLLAMGFHRFGTISDYKQDTDDAVFLDYSIAPIGADEISKMLRSSNPTVIYFSKYPLRIKRRSYNYMFHIISIAIFYSIPATQLAVISFRILTHTGNQDLCYFNFMCSHPDPIFGLHDLNHVFSNISYIIFGFLFVGVVADRHILVKMTKARGIPQHYGLFHAMGITLITEGLLSACYHVCPGEANYQFDTSFMYIMATLALVKLYQNRHPDLNATAYTTFIVLGMIVFMATVGILNETLEIRIIFVVSYALLCIAISLKVYFLNYAVQSMKEFKGRIEKYGFHKKSLVPIRKGRFIVLLITNLANYSLLIVGLILYPVFDFGTFLLGLLLGNDFIYTSFYVAMKIIHKERICCEANLYGILSFVFWALSFYFFLDACTSWSSTPAASRQWNKKCVLFDFFDSHDIWHILSAPALYFYFMFLMCIDDDIIDKKRNQIPAF